MKSKLLDLGHPDIVALKNEILEFSRDESQIIGACYRYVRDKIKFGYNSSDDLTASEVLRDGYGQCNTKATLLISLLTACGIENRLHGFTIDKKLQYGAITGIFYKIAPREILHSWVEVKYQGQWYNLEGFILDTDYLEAIKKMAGKNVRSFCGYGVACKDLQNPEVDWKGGNSTYIQKEGIVRDLGLYETPDEFYEKFGTNPKGIRKFFYKYFIRFLMNKNVSDIRKRPA